MCSTEALTRRSVCGQANSGDAAPRRYFANTWVQLATVIRRRFCLGSDASALVNRRTLRAVPSGLPTAPTPPSVVNQNPAPADQLTCPNGSFIRGLRAEAEMTSRRRGRG